MKTPGALVEASESVVPRVSVPVCVVESVSPRVCGYECGPGVRGVAVRIHQCVEMRAATHAYRECKGVRFYSNRTSHNSHKEHFPIFFNVGKYFGLVVDKYRPHGGYVMVWCTFCQHRCELLVVIQIQMIWYENTLVSDISTSFLIAASATR